LKPPLIPYEENYVPIPISNMCSVSGIVFQVKECIFLIRKIQIKLRCTLETCLKIASFDERKQLVEVELLTFISILTIRFTTFTKIIENKITAL
jgi:hypothetical protein